MTSFRLLDESDYELLLDWLQRPHVKAWWDDGDDNLERVKRHYSKDPGIVFRFLLLSDDLQPLGYFQYYIESEEVIGIDQFLGDASSLDRGIGSVAIRAFISLIEDRHTPKAIIVDPESDNYRAIRCYEKVGFAHYLTRVGNDGKEAYFMRLELGA